MKKFNLAAFSFALYTIYNNGTLSMTVEGKEMTVHANAKGLVQLTASADGVLGKKPFKAGETVAVKLSDISTWPEPKDWVEVPLTDEQKSELKTKRKELATNLENATQEMLKAFGKPEFTDLAGKVNDANKELEKFDLENPLQKAKAKAKPEKEYTEEEKKAIEAYDKAVKEFEAAEAVVKTTKEAVKTARTTLPDGYKVKHNGGLKPPTVNDQIRTAMFYDFTVNKMTMVKLAAKYGYSSSYCNLIVKGSKSYKAGIEETEKAYKTIGEKAAKEYAESYKLVLS